MCKVRLLILVPSFPLSFSLSLTTLEKNQSHVTELTSQPSRSFPFFSSTPTSNRPPPPPYRLHGSLLGSSDLGSLQINLVDDEKQLENGWMEGVLCWVAADAVESCGEFQFFSFIQLSFKADHLGFLRFVCSACEHCDVSFARGEERRGRGRRVCSKKLTLFAALGLGLSCRFIIYESCMAVL